MKRCLILALIVAAISSAVGYASCPHVAVRHQQQVVFAHNGFVAVPYAIPVGVPSYVQYVAQPTPQPVPQPCPPISPPDEEPLVDPLAPEQQAKSSPKSFAERLTAKAPASLRTTACSKCHNGHNPKTSLDLSGEIDCETKLLCIQRILADDPAKRMPKGKPLAPDAIGQLIQEISR